MQQLARYDYVTSLLKELHWLRVPERIEFKLRVLMYRCLNDSGPAYTPLTVLFTTSDGRQVTYAVVLIVNVSRPGDTSYDTG